MARNQEKSHSMLNRWTTYKRMLSGSIKPMGRRPTSSSDVDNLTDCERWRMQIIREIGKKVVEIQNESLGEQRIRDLNDEINKLFREKAHWERRIIELGGPNYRKFEKMADEAMFEGKEIPGISDQKGHAYKYFGAAKNLPGVKELYARKERDAKRQKRFDMRGIDASYYGYNDEDDLLEGLERDAEKKALDHAVKDWKATRSEDAQEDSLSKEFAAQENLFIATVNIPTREHIERILLEKRKENVMKKYLMEEKEKQESGKKTV